MEAARMSGIRKSSGAVKLHTMQQTPTAGSALQVDRLVRHAGSDVEHRCGCQGLDPLFAQSFSSCRFQAETTTWSSQIALAVAETVQRLS